MNIKTDHLLNSQIYNPDGSLDLTNVNYENINKYKSWNPIPSFPHNNEPSNKESFTKSSFTKSYYSLKECDLKKLKDEFVSWVNDDLYFVLRVFDGNTFKSVYKWCKCAKRGNDVYKYRVNERFKDIINYSDDVVFFNHKYRDLFKKDVYTSALYIVLTDDKKRCDLNTSWETLGKEFNKYVTSLKRSYGDISYIRSWESFKNGRPHINMIVLFKDYKFKVFRDNKGKFRIVDKKGLEMWHSFIDVQAMYSLKGALYYITKYITKGLLNNDDSSVSTMSLLWYFKKRSYAVSKSFNSLIEQIRLDYNKHNSIKKFLSIGQISLNNNLEYEFIGVFKIDFKKDWFFITKLPPDEFILFHKSSGRSIV